MLRCFIFPCFGKSRKSLVRVIKFEGVASSPRALNCERNWKRSEQKSNQTLYKIRRRNPPKRCSFRHLLPERLRSRYRTQKSRSQGSPGCPRRVPERPWSVPGRSLEHPRSALGAPKSPPKRPECVRGVSEGPSGHHFGCIRSSKWRSASPFGHNKELRFQHPVLHRGGPCERREIEKGSAGITKRADARAQTHGGTRHYTSAQGRFPFLPLQVM